MLQYATCTKLIEISTVCKTSNNVALFIHLNCCSLYNLYIVVRIALKAKAKSENKMKRKELKKEIKHFTILIILIINSRSNMN